MKLRKIIFGILYIYVFSQALAQNKYTISGNIKDKRNGEDLIGATVVVVGTSIATSTNAYGFFSMSLPEGKYKIAFQYVGYKTIIQDVDLVANQKIEIEIAEEKIELKEVEITAERPDQNVRSNQMSVNKLGIKEISRIPALFGEVDVIRSIQLLPGVSSVGEGASGFNVRGGSIDQNLILLDEAPVYNSSHLFGFFSVFNPDAVKDVKLYKGGIPAQYGGRLSSLLDVRLKEGNNKRLAVQGGIGSIFSRLTIEAPIKKDKGSFIIAGRRSYIDALIAPALAGNPDLKGLRLYFYDLTLKANYNLGKNDKVFLSGYLGKDEFGQASFGFNWGNQTLSARWNHVFSDKLFFNLTGFYSRYNYGLGAETNSSGDGFKWESSIQNYSIKPEFTWYLNPNNTISFGAQSIFYDFFPGEITIKVAGDESKNRLSSKYGLENAVYVANEQKITARLTATYGLRFSNFNYIDSSRQDYDQSKVELNQKKRPISTAVWNSPQFLNKYWNPEPRLALKYELNEKSSLKTSYMRTVQYLHLISNTAASVPLDVWTPATNNIKPQTADQVALGYFRNFGEDNDYEASVEGYYKSMRNQLDFVDNADLLLNPNLEGEVLNGKGRAYGLEFYVKKNKGPFTGWISYTLARTERQVNGLSENNWYPNRFDRTHTLSIVANYDVQNKFLFFNDRWRFAANVFYGSGTPVNLPTNGYAYGQYFIPHSPNNIRNNLRIPDFFRFDISATLKNKKRPEPENGELPKSIFKRLKYTYEWELVMGVYNTFNMRNAFSLVARENPAVADNDAAVFQANEVNSGYKSSGLNNVYQKFSVISFFVPSVTYNFKF